ncbi:MAG TPA: hypothetical protein VGT43_05650 [Burkholderiales bacterium]|nr:hypothetical protein [Burkholderiales bacterium]
MRLLIFILLAAALGACDRGVQRGGANEGSGAQSAGGVSSEEGKAARRAASGN